MQDIPVQRAESVMSAGQKVSSVRSSQGQEEGDLVYQLMEKLARLEMVVERQQQELAKARSGDDPTVEERLAAVEQMAQRNSEDVTDIRVINGRQDIFIDTNAQNTVSNLEKINSNNVTINDNQVHVGYLEQRVSFMDITRPPVGTILPWLGLDWAELPSGWQRCDGSQINTGRMTGTVTPDLNSAGLFLRGSEDSRVGELEQQSLEEHTHTDNGHSHTDQGHGHSDSGHSHKLDGGHGGSANDGAYPAFIERKCDYVHDEKVIVDVDSGNSYYCVDTVWDTMSTTANIQWSQANIQPSSSHMGFVEGATVGHETRPANMRVVYIVRIY